MRTAKPRLALLSLALAACAGGAPPASAPAPAAAGPDSSFLAEEAQYRQRADSLRGAILGRAEWTDLGGDACRPGAFRTYRGDSASTPADTLIARLERLIIVRGVEQPIDTPQGHALVRAVLAWEADAARPKWDVASGATREAIAPGLAGEVHNPATGVCDRYVPNDDLTFVIPPFTSFKQPDWRGSTVQVVSSEDGLKQARDRFFAAATDADPIFTYTRVAPVVLWREYAVVAVDRPAEYRAVHQLAQGAGGATYLFRREKNEWRLLSIVRAWGR